MEKSIISSVAATVRTTTLSEVVWKAKSPVLDPIHTKLYTFERTIWNLHQALTQAHISVLYKELT